MKKMRVIVSLFIILLLLASVSLKAQTVRSVTKAWRESVEFTPLDVDAEGKFLIKEFMRVTEIVLQDLQKETREQKKEHIIDLGLVGGIDRLWTIALSLAMQDENNENNIELLVRAGIATANFSIIFAEIFDNIKVKKAIAKTGLDYLQMVKPLSKKKEEIIKIEAKLRAI